MISVRQILGTQLRTVQPVLKTISITLVVKVYLCNFVSPYFKVLNKICFSD